MIPLLAEISDVAQATDIQGDRFFEEFLNMLSSLGLILVILFAVVWLIRRMGQKRLTQLNDTSMIKVLESRPLSQKTLIHLVELEGTAIVITESAGGVTKIAEFELERVVK